MIDHVIINVNGGNGGNGAVSGRREKFVPLGGPDGGDGGNGGNVIFRCDSSVGTLIGFRNNQRIKAFDGTNGSGGTKHGKNGGDREVLVPVGTEIWIVGAERWCKADLSENGQSVVIAKGGVGGKGNARFVTSTNQFPLLAESGDRGDRLKVRLELKLLADVGIIGSPNAGKSSLLSSVTAAKPRIADYPFTTLEPVLGVVERDRTSFVMVDIPGLIEGAHEGTGLGDKFLKHVQRTRVLIHVIDGTVYDLVEEYRKIRKELALFSKDLAGKQEIIVVNKLDIAGVESKFNKTKKEIEKFGVPIHCISAVGRQGLHELIGTAIQLLSKVNSTSKSNVKEVKDIPVLRPMRDEDKKVVKKQEGVYVVISRHATRLAAMVDETNWGAKVQLYEKLRRLGVIDALQKAGIKEGDIFKVGGLEWKWE